VDDIANEIPGPSMAEFIAELAHSHYAIEDAALHVARGDGNRLVVLPERFALPGALNEDGVNAIAAIDLIRLVVAEYETDEEA
jgi:hypothetical protein